MLAALPSRAPPPRMKVARGKGKSKGKKATVAEKAGKGGWKPAVCVRGYSLVGGLLKKPTHLDVEILGGEAFTKLTKNQAWLCMAASGKARGLQPLARTDVIEILASMVADAAGGGAGPAIADPAGASSSRLREPSGTGPSMAAFDLDGDANKGPLPRRRGARRANNSKAARPLAQPLTLDLPPELTTDQTSQVRCLSGPPRGRSGNAPWLHVDDLGWLVDKLADQVRNGGVSFVPSPSSLRKPFWSERDHSWICRAKAPGGDLIRKSLAVPIFQEEGLEQVSRSSRRPLTESEWQHAKQKKLAEIEEWQEAVEGGFIVE